MKAAEFLNVSKQAIYPILDKTTNNTTVKGYNVCYLKDYKEGISFKTVNRGRAKYKVEKLSKDNKLLKIYNSLAEAADDNNTTNKLISACIKGRSKTCAGFKWKKHE